MNRRELDLQQAELLKHIVALIERLLDNQSEIFADIRDIQTIVRKGKKNVKSNK